MKININISKEELEAYYNEIHSLENTAKHFGIGVDKLNKLFKEFGIQKRKRSWSEESLAKLKSKDRRDKISKAFKNMPEEKKQQRVEKIKDTTIKRHGVKSFPQSPAYIEKTNQTCLNRYGVLYYSQTQKYKDAKHEYYENLTEEEWVAIDNKRKSTMRDKYDVDYYCMHPDAKNKNKRDSHPNLEFIELLKKSGIEVDEVKNREFRINNYQYDFKFDNVLIEINPSVTHNSTFGIYHSDPLDENYHYNKTKLALDNGYKCINVYDWVNKQAVIELIKSNNFELKEREIKVHFYNLKTDEHSYEEPTGNNWVKIYDDGFDIIFN